MAYCPSIPSQTSSRAALTQALFDRYLVYWKAYRWLRCVCMYESVCTERGCKNNNNNNNQLIMPCPASSHSRKSIPLRIQAWWALRNSSMEVKPSPLTCLPAPCTPCSSSPSLLSPLLVSNCSRASDRSIVGIIYKALDTEKTNQLPYAKVSQQTLRNWWWRCSVLDQRSLISLPCYTPKNLHTCTQLKRFFRLAYECVLLSKGQGDACSQETLRDSLYDHPIHRSGSSQSFSSMPMGR